MTTDANERLSDWQLARRILDALIEVDMLSEDDEINARNIIHAILSDHPPGGDDGSATRKDAGTALQGSGRIGSPLPPGTSPDPRYAALVEAAEAVLENAGKYGSGAEPSLDINFHAEFWHTVGVNQLKSLRAALAAVKGET